MKRLSIATVLLLVCCAFALQAGTITYTEEAVVTGTVGATPFTSALLQLTFVGDTANVTGGPTFFTNSAGTLTFSIAGVGSGTITDSMRVFDNQTFAPPAAGIGGTVVGTLLATFNAAFATYDLTTAIGPITGDSFIRTDLSFGTTLGALNLQAARQSTFTASVGSVPEPATFGLMGLGFGALVLMRRRRSL